jgi:hypothetical protein
MIGILSKKPAVEKVISFFDFDTTISIKLFLGFFCWEKWYIAQNLVNPYRSFQEALNAKWHNAGRGLLKKQKPFCNIIDEIGSIFSRLEHRWLVLYSFLDFEEKG